MAVHNADVAAAFDEMADLLEIDQANPFRVRAYRTAARMLGALPRDLNTLVVEGRDPAELPGIGKDLASKIRELLATGRCRALDELRHATPPTVVELLRVPGLGPKRVKLLVDRLHVATLPELVRAAHEGRVQRVPGFGDKLARAIVDAEHLATEPRRLRLAQVVPYAEALVARLERVPGVAKVAVAGSYRRLRETVGDLDVLVTAKPRSPVMARFLRDEEVAQVLAQGPTRATVALRSGLRVDLRVVPPASYGAALHYFTGSQAHNIAVRRRGQQRGLKINEYGVFRGARRVAGATEASVFAAVGLPWIPPELREDRGELEAAERGALPRLVELADLRGDLHAHTTATDGRNTLAEMAEAARRHGLSYLAITEHSRRLRMVRGLDPAGVRAHIRRIDALNARLRGITLLKGIEVDILEDGRLDLPDEVLAQLDVVNAAVHHRFDLPRAKQTERILRALDNRYVTALAHPTGRLLGRRPPYALDVERVLEAARQRGCFVEINAQPERLDLDDTYSRMAKDAGVLVCIDSDAHSVLDFDQLRFGVGQARRGWIEARDVVNTRPLVALRKLLRKRR